MWLSHLTLEQILLDSNLRLSQMYLPSKGRLLLHLRHHPLFCYMHLIYKHRPADSSYEEWASTCEITHRTVRSFLTNKRKYYCTVEKPVSAIDKRRKPNRTDNLLQHTLKTGKITTTQIKTRFPPRLQSRQRQENIKSGALWNSN